MKERTKLLPINPAPPVTRRDFGANEEERLKRIIPDDSNISSYGKRD